MKFFVTAMAAFFTASAGAAAVESLDHAAIAKVLYARAESMVKRCDRDFYDSCIDTCYNPGCPGCAAGCTIGCCGSTGCC